MNTVQLKRPAHIRMSGLNVDEAYLLKYLEAHRFAKDKELRLHFLAHFYDGVIRGKCFDIKMSEREELPEVEG